MTFHSPLSTVAHPGTYLFHNDRFRELLGLPFTLLQKGTTLTRLLDFLRNNSLVAEDADSYTLMDTLLKGGRQHSSLRDAAKIEIGMRAFLQDGNFAAYTDTFEDLHGMTQLPGIASQRLMAEGGSHPVRRFTESTYARPVLQALEDEEKAELIRRYEEVMHAAYPVRRDGSVLFPFRRLFFTLTV